MGVLVSVTGKREFTDTNQRKESCARASRQLLIYFATFVSVISHSSEKTESTAHRDTTKCKYHCDYVCMCNKSLLGAFKVIQLPVLLENCSTESAHPRNTGVPRYIQVLEADEEAKERET